MATGVMVSAPDGHKIVYDVDGNGPALLLLTGLMQTRKGWRERGYTGRLSRKWRVVAIDPLGHGESDKPHVTDAYGLKELADHSAAVLDAAGIERADVWGYSRGALLLVALMQFHPDRIRSAVAGGVNLGELGGAPVGSGRSDPESLATALRRGDWPTFWESYPELPPELRARMESDNDPLAIAAVIEARYQIGVDPSQFRGMVYVGDGESFSEETAKIAPLLNLHCAVLPTGGHADTFAAMDVVCDAVEPFLESSSQDPRA